MHNDNTASYTPNNARFSSMAFGVGGKNGRGPLSPQNMTTVGAGGHSDRNVRFNMDMTGNQGNDRTGAPVNLIM